MPASPIGLIGTLVAGARIVCSNATEPAKVLDVIERERPTQTNGYAPVTLRLAQDPSFAARDLILAQAGQSPPDHARSYLRPADPDLRHNIYGMTEAGSALTMSSDETDQPEHRRGSLGQLLPGFEARIVDPQTREDMPPGEVGELWLRGPLMMQGYYGRPRSEVFEPDGWWRSGDLCRIDADGFFYIAGRLGEMIKTSGANVSPREVEAVLRLITGASECIVLGLPDPGARRGGRGGCGGHAVRRSGSDARGGGEAFSLQGSAPDPADRPGANCRWCRAARSICRACANGFARVGGEK